MVVDPVRGRLQQGLDLAIEDGDELSGSGDTASVSETLELSRVSLGQRLKDSSAILLLRRRINSV